MKSYMGAGSYPRRGIDEEYMWWKSNFSQESTKRRSTRKSPGTAWVQRFCNPPFLTRNEHSAKNVLLDDDGFVAAFILFDENGDKLICDDPDDFANLVVGVRIIDWVEENRQGESVNANAGK